MTPLNSPRQVKTWELRTKFWWRAHGYAVIRHAVEVTLCVAIVLISWQLAAPWLPHTWGQHAAKDPVIAPNVPSKPTDSQTLAATIVNYHLFGTTPHATPNDVAIPVASTPGFQLIGIIYSSDPSESVALLDQGGVGVIALNGMSLSNGARVVSIQSDHVVIDHQGIRESVLLNMKKADINAHFSPAQFVENDDSGNEQHNPALSTTTRAQEPLNETSSIVTGNRPTLVTPHFKSLKQLRGRNAMHRFRGFQDARPPAQ